MKNFIYIDIDGVLCLGSEIHPKLTKWGYVHRFNNKAVRILNEILEKSNSDMIISSDWRIRHSLSSLQEIFEWQNVIKVPLDITPVVPYSCMQLLEENRATEVLMHVDKHKPDRWVAIDDLDLKTWIPDKNFVLCPRFMEGIKQTGKKNEILTKLNIK